MLIDLMEGEQLASWQISLPAEIIIRDSTRATTTDPWLR
jgi:DNA-binding LacI/PurR family transcriptional regulator